MLRVHPKTPLNLELFFVVLILLFLVMSRPLGFWGSQLLVAQEVPRAER
jgi:hypothetical protein